MKRPARWSLVIAAAALCGAFLRLWDVERRPMHGDEAVHAVKFGELLEEGSYAYNPKEYHGPTLNYFTLIPAWLSGAGSLEQVSEWTLRVVPVFFGVALIVLLLMVGDGVGGWAAAVAAILTAVSPAFVFYSRYYIQEMLLVSFSFGAVACGWRWLRGGKVGWAVLAGVFLGLAHATKETFVIVLFSMGVALAATVLLYRGQEKVNGRRIKRSHIFLIAASAAVVSVLFYSSFLANPRGVVDSVRAYAMYLHRAGQNQIHVHPWYYYIRMLVWWRFGNGPVWSEGLIVLLGVVGFVAAAKGKVIDDVDVRLARFIGFYTLIMAVIYSAIPYKTPWCMLGFLHGLILLAGVGVGVIMQRLPTVSARVVVGVILAAGVVHLGWQSWLASFKYCADSRNPYVYAHPTEDVVRLARRVEELAEVHPLGRAMEIEVICPQHDYWPLPWYLRGFSRVGWFGEVPTGRQPAPVIIASSSVESEIADLIYGQGPGRGRLYVRAFREDMYLRPGKVLRCYVSNELWDSFMRGRTGAMPGP